MTHALLPRRRIGRTEIEIAVMALGAAPLGGLFRASSQRDATFTVRAALDAGVNLIDVAPQYGQGLAEERVGKSIAALPGRSFFLSTKVGRLLEPVAGDRAVAPNWAEGLPFATVYDVTPEGIRRSVGDSIARLGGRKPDILLLHDPDRYAEGPELTRLIERAHATLTVLKEEGAVKAIGIGVNAPEPCLMGLDIGEWDCFLLAGSHSVLLQEDRGLLERCQRASTSVLVGGAYMSGALAGGSTWRYGPIPDEVARDIARLKKIGARYGVSMQALALQFPLLDPAVAAIVVGMRTPGEVRENLAFIRCQIPAECWRDLATEGIIPERYADPNRLPQ